MLEDPSGADREPDGGDDAVEPGETPDSIDVQPEDPDYPGQGSPEPID
jgi:hypothetical protein